MKDDRCPNCGSNWDHKDICEKCGYKEIASKELYDFDLIYCSGCGCTFSTGACSNPEHKDLWEKVKL